MGTLIPHVARGDGSSDPALRLEVAIPEDVLGVGLGSDILVVDDDESSLVAYEAALAPLGRRLVLARSGVEALAKLLDQDFALMLLDVAMPEMTGIETARLARQRPRNQGLPIVFITGGSWTDETIIEAYDIGAFDFVVKPILPEILRAKVRIYLALQERTAVMLSNARRLAEARQQLSDTEAELRANRAAAAILEKLRAATAALSQAMTPHQVADVVVQIGAEAVGAAAAAIWFVESEHRLELAASYGVPDEYMALWQHIPADSQLPVTRVMQSCEPLWVEDESQFARVAPAIFETAKAAHQASAFAALPLISRGSASGVLSFAFSGEHRFSDDERKFLMILARTCEHALERARLFIAESEARRDAEAASARKDQYIATLGHELRNPLAAIAGALELVKIREGTLGRELTILDRHVGHLTHLVNDLVDVSRLTHGRISLQRETVEVALAFEDVIELARPVLDRYVPELTLHIAPGLLVDADRQRFVQVFANLLTNAARYASRAAITITAERDGARVRLTVRDTGIGIAPDVLPHVFDPFVQAEHAIDRENGGLGIGLTIVKAVVLLHGGEVHAESAGIGQGATFTVLWPAASSRTRTARSPPLRR